MMGGGNKKCGDKTTNKTGENQAWAFHKRKLVHSTMRAKCSGAEGTSMNVAVYRSQGSVTATAAGAIRKLSFLRGPSLIELVHIIVARGLIEKGERAILIKGAKWLG